jgi:hypothetical protein
VIDEAERKEMMVHVGSAALRSLQCSVVVVEDTEDEAVMAYVRTSV